MVETQTTIAQWAADTFGEKKSNIRIAVRIQEELTELLKKLAIDDDDPKAQEELTDIIIVAYTLADRMDFELMHDVDRKMAVNRSRTWKLDGSGCGQHID